MNSRALFLVGGAVTVVALVVSWLGRNGYREVLLAGIVGHVIGIVLLGAGFIIERTEKK